MEIRDNGTTLVLSSRKAISRFLRLHDNCNNVWYAFVIASKNIFLPKKLQNTPKVQLKLQFKKVLKQYATMVA